MERPEAPDEEDEEPPTPPPPPPPPPTFPPRSTPPMVAPEEETPPLVAAASARLDAERGELGVNGETEALLGVPGSSLWRVCEFVRRLWRGNDMGV